MRLKISNLNVESERHSKDENIEFRGSKSTFIKQRSIGVLFFKGTLGKKASYLKLPIKNQDMKKRENVWIFECPSTLTSSK